MSHNEPHRDHKETLRDSDNLPPRKPPRCRHPNGPADDPPGRANYFPQEESSAFLARAPLLWRASTPTGADWAPKAEELSIVALRLNSPGSLEPLAWHTACTQWPARLLSSGAAILHNVPLYLATSRQFILPTGRRASSLSLPSSLSATRATGAIRVGGELAADLLSLTICQRREIRQTLFGSQRTVRPALCAVHCALCNVLRPARVGRAQSERHSNGPSQS